MSHTPQLYLASGSPRRQEILQQMGVTFSVVPQNIEEQYQPGEAAQDYVLRLALEKSKDGLKGQIKQKIPVLGADTIVVLDGKILEKPDNREHGIEMLLSLSGHTHQVMTAVALSNENKIESAVSVSEVIFAPVNRKMCENYWQTGEPVDKAGAYAVQGQGALFIKNINGSYTGVMGLPVYETGLLLNQFGINLL